MAKTWRVGWSQGPWEPGAEMRAGGGERQEEGKGMEAGGLGA